MQRHGCQLDVRALLRWFQLLRHTRSYHMTLTHIAAHHSTVYSGAHLGDATARYECAAGGLLTHPAAGGHVDEKIAAYHSTILLRAVVCACGKHRRDHTVYGSDKTKACLPATPACTARHPNPRLIHIPKFQARMHAQEVLTSVSEVISAGVTGPSTLSACASTWTQFNTYTHSHELMTQVIIRNT